MSESNVADRLRTLLRELYPGVSLAKIARTLKVSANTINNYLQGRRLPSAEFLFDLAAAGADAQWLLTGEGVPLADSDTDRALRVADALEHLSRSSLLAEVDRRLRSAIEAGAQALSAVAEYDLESLAKKMGTAEGVATLTPEERDLVRLVHRAFWTIEDVMYFFPDLDPKLHETHEKFLALHEKVTADRAFRVIHYAADKHLVVSRSTP